MKHKLTSFNVRTDGRPFAVIKTNLDGKPDYSNLSLVALTDSCPTCTYQVTGIGVKLHSLRGLESLSQKELEEAINDTIIYSNEPRNICAIKNLTPLRVSFDEKYLGLLFFGKEYDPELGDSSKILETIPMQVLGNLRVEEYTYNPKTSRDFQKIISYLDKRRQNPDSKNVVIKMPERRTAVPNYRMRVG